MSDLFYWHLTLLTPQNRRVNVCGNAVGVKSNDQMSNRMLLPILYRIGGAGKKFCCPAETALLKWQNREPRMGTLLKAFQAILNEQFHQETVAALQPGLTNEARQYNAGRAAAIADLSNHLARLFQKAKTPEKLKS